MQVTAALLLALVVVILWEYGEDAAAGSEAAAFSDAVSGVADYCRDAWVQWRAGSR